MGAIVFLVLLLLSGAAALLLRYSVQRHAKSSGAARWGWLGLGNLAAVFVLVTALLLAAEVYYRYWFDEPDSTLISHVAQRWVKRHYKFNERGIRDNIDYELAKTPGKPRLTFLGDSFTAAHGVADVDDRFANLVRDNLPGCDVHCLAVNGHDTAAEIALLHGYFAEGYETDLVVLVYCLNDLGDLIAAVTGRHDPGHLVTRAESIGLLRQSYAIDLWHCRWILATDIDGTDHFGQLIDAYQGEIWPRQKLRLETLANMCKRQGVRLAVVVFPFVTDLEGDLYDDAHAKIDAHFRDAGIPLLDLRSLMRQHADEPLRVNRYDSHPSEHAHALAAEAIEIWLQSDLRFPPSAPEVEAAP